MKMDRGKYDEAEQLLAKPQIMGSMLASSPNPRARAGLLAALGSIYPDHVGLLLGTLDPARPTPSSKERGRTYRPREVRPTGSAARPEPEKEFSTLRLKIASSHSAVEIGKPGMICSSAS